MLNELQQRGASLELAELMMELLSAVRDISKVIVTADTGKVGTKNAFGEEQAAMDVQAETIMQATLKSCPFVLAFGSEELDEIMTAHDDGKFSVFYDPLDGSSLLDVNFSVGTIVGIFEGSEVIGRSCRDQVGALFAVYGPRTTVMMTLGQGVMEFTLQGDEWVMSMNEVKLDGKKNYFAPGNLRATKEREDYMNLVEHYMREQYTLRYSGGMVPDLNHILKKGSGIFMYPGMPSKPDGKLRLLYECGPMAMIMEQAGGAASTGRHGEGSAEAVAILDLPIESYVQTTPILIGQKNEVERAVEFLMT